mmetsp:Transcript_43296/g.135357  ORF Transcript_43296/g.135357 Transcript_43296/m.135357 type:complete len:776 (+) Transcript_43296:48-2375(+)
MVVLSLVRFTLACRLAVVAIGGSTNPFLDQQFYINPVNAKEFDSSIATAAGTVKSNLQKMQTVPSAYWIDRKIKIRGQTTTTVEGILKDASSKSPPELVVLMFYDLPNRDCDAKASNGEICCSKNADGTCDYMAPGDCADGIQEYKTGYVDPFVSVLAAYEGRLPVALVMEPDGLANLATNIADPHCGNMATQTAYKQGVKYAVEQITTKAPSVSIYLDAAHGGWLGWQNNLESFMKMLKGMSLPFDKIRGFATNVANYQALGVQCPWCPDQGFRNGYCMNGKHGSDPCCADPCSLLSQWNFGNNELNYAAGLVAAANSVLGMDAHVIIDTGRNGVTDQRQDCANWCNPRGAGTGVPSTTKTANTSLVDAYFWLKTPGESDGCSQILPDGKECPRFDAKCASVDSIGGRSGEAAAPEAGMWFDFQVKQLAENAHFDPPEASSEGSCPASANGASQAMPVDVATEPSSATVQGSSGSSSGQCAGAYQQCGGQTWTGPTCCETGCTCTSSGGFYSQCTPSDPSAGGVCSAGSLASSGSLATAGSLGQLATVQSTTGALAAPGGVLTPSAVMPMPVPTSAPSSIQMPALKPQEPSAPAPQTLQPVAVPPALPSALPTGPLAPAPAPLQPAADTQQCAVPYGQCGGSAWDGPTCCDVFCTCQVVSAETSRCVPQGSAPAGSQPVGFAPSPALAIVLKDELVGDAARTEKHGQSVLGAVARAPWMVIPFALAAVLLASGLARCQLRRAWSAYGSLDFDRRPQSAELASPVATRLHDVEVA